MRHPCRRGRAADRPAWDWWAPFAIDALLELGDHFGDVTVESDAGKRRPSGTRHGNKWLASMLVEAAGSVGRMKGANYPNPARPADRPRGMGRAAVAVAHSMLVTAYYILLRDEPYAELAADWLVRTQ